ncbi:MAG TPA: hypothetical protein VGO03_01825 [Acidimicrobiia bacterium]
MAILDSVDLDGLAPQDVACPICGASVAQRFYGPCPECRTGLRDRLAGEARDVEQAEYVPKMNVTPNAVAVKDD